MFLTKSSTVFLDLKSELTKLFTDKCTHLITYIRTADNSELTIKIKFQKETELNFMKINIFFYINIDYLFPTSTPYVYCYTNVIF